MELSDHLDEVSRPSLMEVGVKSLPVCSCC
jgi:hypothetical protein